MYMRRNEKWPQKLGKSNKKYLDMYGFSYVWKNQDIYFILTK